MKKWILLALMIGILAVTYNLSSKVPTTFERSEIDRTYLLKSPPTQKRPPVKSASMTPGRVVELQMENGKIEFVLFEKDCPLTTKRITDLVAAKAYDGVAFPRVEDWVVQTEEAKKPVKNMNVELTDKIKNIVGAVGMARKTAYNTNLSSFYILLRSAHHLDRGYTVFGQVIRGMDVIENIKANDKILKATLRPLTREDETLLKKALDESQ